ncbi:MAG: NAD(P)H-dependent oxidoreductase [Rhodopirellula sp.]|nr:NAD(P)H-dependent oxidoreductase [Rhodopirellula sp.]
MKVLVVLGHQSKGSFCHAIADTAMDALSAAGHDLTFHDLYDEQFDPILPHPEIPKQAELPALIRQHCDEVAAADGYVVVHPNWWGQPPAMLKGWIDRVFRQGVTYEFAAGGKINGFLQGKTAQVFTTSNTPRDVELQWFGDPLENLWKTCVFDFCGLKDFERRNFESIVLSAPQQRQDWLAEVQEIIRRRFPH